MEWEESLRLAATLAIEISHKSSYPLMKRIAIGGIVHETNTFSPNLTRIEDFTRQASDSGPALIERWQNTATSLGGALEALHGSAYEMVPLCYATAMPSGLITANAYETLLGGLLNPLAEALPVDGILLVLHGAMVAEAQDDCEGEILQLVREMVGDACPIVAVLDMHGTLTDRMVTAADVLVAFNKNPHSDAFDRGLEAAHLLKRILEDGSRWAKSFVNVPLLLSALTTATDRLPLRAMHEQAQAFRQDPRVVNISIMGGFAYSDTYSAGVSVLVTADDPALAYETRRSLSATAWQNREAATYTGLPVHDAIDRAMRANQGPIILADVGDNVGGGSPGDGTVLLRGLLEANAQEAVIVLADPEAVHKAIQVGVGGAVELLIGGKQDHWHGEPVKVRGVVQNLTDGRFRAEGVDHFANIYGQDVQMGKCATLRCGGIDILLTFGALMGRLPPKSTKSIRRGCALPAWTGSPIRNCGGQFPPWIADSPQPAAHHLLFTISPKFLHKFPLTSS